MSDAPQNGVDKEITTEDDVLVINLSRKERKVRITDVNGTTGDYLLREMMGTDRDKWMNTIGSRMQIDPGTGKSVTLKNYDGLQAGLIAKCLYKAGTDVPVPLEVIQLTFPATAQEALFEACQKLNGLDKTAKDEAKKD